MSASNALVDLRAELADQLNGVAPGSHPLTSQPTGAKAYVTVPEEAGPPLVTIAAGRPYISYEGANFGCAIVRHQVLAIVEPGENESEDEALDALVLEVIAALAGTRFTVEEVDQPGEYTVIGQSCLGVSLSVWTDADLRPA